MQHLASCNIMICGQLFFPLRMLCQESQVTMSWPNWQETKKCRRRIASTLSFHRPSSGDKKQKGGTKYPSYRQLAPFGSEILLYALHSRQYSRGMDWSRDTLFMVCEGTCDAAWVMWGDAWCGASDVRGRVMRREWCEGTRDAAWVMCEGMRDAAWVMCAVWGTGRWGGGGCCWRWPDL
jgi:hypothetical protein